MEVLLFVVFAYWVLKGIGVSMAVANGVNNIGDLVLAVALVVIWPVITGISETI